VGGDGQVRCDGCGHAFAAAGAAPAPSAPPAFKAASSFQPISTTLPAPPVKYQPAYPPASGPQKTGNPGLVACGIVALFGVMGLLCCGALGVVVYQLGNQQIADNDAVAPPFNPPPFNPLSSNPPPINPPGVPPPFPEIPPPPLVPEVPTVDSSPFVPVTPPEVSIPGTPLAAPPPKTLDDFLQAMRTIDPMNFTARQLLDEMNRLPVEEGRRGEVIEALLQMLGRAGVHASGLLAGPAQTTLENWMSKAEATKVAEFAAGEAQHFSRRHLLKQLARVGGDAKTAEALLPLLMDPTSTFTLPEVFEKIGPEAEDALLSQVDAAEIPSRRALYSALAKVGGKKSAEILQARIDKGDGFDRVFGAQALHQIQSRGTDQ
jgi:hypothetical protein